MSSDSFRLQKITPRGVLAPFIGSVRVISHGGEMAPYVRLPDGQLELIVRLGDDRPSINVIGPRRSALRKPAAPRGQSFLVRFRPGGARPFFGVSMAELTDQVVPLELVARSFATRLIDTAVGRSTEARVEHLLGALERACVRDVVPAGAAAVQRALAVIAAASELPRVAELSERAGVSTRHLRRAFDDVVGIGPKEYLRIVRFQRALRRMKTRTSSLGRVAHEYGYYDQAHMIADFRALTGCTPTKLI